MTKSDSKKNNKTKKEPIIEEEMVQEEPIKEKIVEIEKPLNLAEKSTAELDKLEADIENQKIQNHLESERKRIEEISCKNCGNNLELQPEDYMKQNNTPFKLECKKCEKQQTITIQYTEPPETGTAIIEVKSGNYAWEVNDPSTWKDKHVQRWMEDEQEKLETNRSTLKPNEKKLFRVLQLLAQKQKIIK